MSLREGLVGLGRWLPTARIMQRYVPWAALVAAIVGGSWTLVTYRNDLAIQRVAATFDMHRQFRERFPNGSEVVDDLPLRTLAFTCRFLQAEIAAARLTVDEPRLPACDTIIPSDRRLIEPIADLMSESQRSALRQSLVSHLSTTAAPNWRRATEVRYFYRALTLCSRSQTCDGDIVVALFGPDMLGFVNAVCVYLDSVDAQWQADLKAILALLDEAKWQPVGPTRQSIVFCDRFR